MHKILCKYKGVCSNFKRIIGNSKLKMYPHEIQNAEHWPVSKQNKNYNKARKAGINKPL